jgi:hypothetical protein
MGGIVVIVNFSTRQSKLLNETAMKNLYLLVVACLFLLQGFAQLQNFTIETPTKKRCGTYEVLQGERQLHPETQTDEQFETWLKQKIEERNTSGFRPFATVTLPVVFHIIHNGEVVGTGDNLSATAIQQQLMQLNKDFANLSNSPYPVAADMEIQFALAQNDPGGTPLAEPGIDRRDRNVAGFTAPPYTVGYASPGNNYLTNTIKPATIWDPNRYLNIWVLQMEAGILGIATFPGGSGIPDLGAIGETPTSPGAAVAPFSVGSLLTPNTSCTNNYGRGRTLTHELGHFFGLRHIWGDATCGNDFCGDTPTHQTSNSGVPAHPKPNACGTLDEMFENYMDYTDDIVTNTFTANQKARMQAVITNSPYRSTLVTSTVGLVPVTGNRVFFNVCTSATTVSETGTTGTYPRYKDISFALNVENSATGAATLTINPTGTAVNGFHYQVLTPSVAFATGDALKVVTIRVLDNAQIESSRTLILGYSISGTGVQAAAGGQTVTINITDDDNVAISETPVTLLAENFTGPSFPGWGTITTSGMPNLWTVSNQGNAGGTGNCAYISSSPSAPLLNIYDKTIAGWTTLTTPAINTTGFSDLQLSFKYRAWGQQNLDFAAAVYVLPSAPTVPIQIPAAGAGPFNGQTGIVSGTATINLPNNIFSNNSFRLGFYWQNDDDAAGTDPPVNIDDFLLTGNATRVESTVSSSYGSDVRSGATTNRFRSISNNRVIADVNNLNANVSGLAVSITQAGNSLIPLTTNTGSFSRSQKVIRITPAVANTTATYQVTLYYTTAELAAWAGSATSLKILKVGDGVNLAGTITGSSTSQIVTTTVDDQRATKGYVAYTGSFTGGFSQFMLVSPTATLPVQLLAFEAKPVRRSIVLNWSTAQELNNKGFGIERSTDGTHFEKIGWLDGMLTTNTRTNYTYTDNFVQPGVIYYYQLRQTDIDLREKLSVIRQARIDEGGISLTINPNPATDHISLYISGAAVPAEVSLVNMQGQLVRKWSRVNASSAPYTLNIRGLASGLYMLQIQLPGEKLAEKVLIR